MHLSAESLAQHPAIDPDLFLKPGQASLALFHDPPQTTLVTEHQGRERALPIDWAAPPARVSTSKQRPDIVADGAVAVSCLLLLELTDWRITDVTQRGTGPDYWLGKAPGDHELHLEVSGTDERHLASIVTAKVDQLGKGRTGGYVSVCRFLEPRAHFNYHPRNTP